MSVEFQFHEDYLVRLGLQVLRVHLVLQVHRVLWVHLVFQLVDASLGRLGLLVRLVLRVRL